MQDNPQIELLTARLPLLLQLHEKLSEGAVLSLDGDPDIERILVPHSRYDHQPLHRTLSEIAEERAAIYIELIGLQHRMAKVGVQRVRTLLGMYGFYVRDILSREAAFAKMDIYQQATDVSLMFIINNSQLNFVASLIGKDSPKYKKALREFHTQESEFHHFQNNELLWLDKVEYIDPGPISEEQRLNYLLQYEMTALDVADYNIALALHTGKLIENGARARYYWFNSLQMGRGATGQHVQSHPDLFIPHEDLQYDAEIQKMYLERCDILLGRAVSAYKLAGSLPM